MGGSNFLWDFIDGYMDYGEQGMRKFPLVAGIGSFIFTLLLILGFGVLMVFAFPFFVVGLVFGERKQVIE